jgi:dTDP-glucose 4,6-dehydratase
MRILVTGGAGFIGCNFIRYSLKKHPDNEYVVMDKLTYAGRLENLEDVKDDIKFIRGDISKKRDVETSVRGCDAIINFAAETHVDRSIRDAEIFLKTDIIGTFNLLEAVRSNDIEKFLQISTDEVYGSIKKGSFKENDPLNPASPYSASKASADLLCIAYYKTYKTPVMIARSSNNFGPYQYPEKIIPLFITNLLFGEKVPLYGDGQNIRDWIYVIDNCSGIDTVFQEGEAGEIYNIGGGNEKANIDLTNKLLDLTERNSDFIKYVEDRPGHDRRYSIDCTKLYKLGWRPRHDFDVALKSTVSWYKENEDWWKPIKEGLKN